MVVPIKLNVKKHDFNMYSMCIQCVFKIISSSATAHASRSDQLFIQSVFNVYSMCIQCVFKNILSYMEANNCSISMDYNGSAN